VQLVAVVDQVARLRRHDRAGVTSEPLPASATTRRQQTCEMPECEADVRFSKL